MQLNKYSVWKFKVICSDRTFYASINSESKSQLFDVIMNADGRDW